MSQKTAREINPPTDWLVTEIQSLPRLAQGFLTHRSTNASLPPQLCSLMSQLHPFGKRSGEDLLAGIEEIPSKMHSVEFDSIIFCYVGCGDFEGKCVCSEIHRLQEADRKKVEVYLAILSAFRVSVNTVGVYANYLKTRDCTAWNNPQLPVSSPWSEVISSGPRIITCSSFLPDLRSLSSSPVCVATV